MKSPLLVFMGLTMCSASAFGAWSDWWQTPEQKAAEALRQGDFETLQRVAPNSDWRAVGEYESGNFNAAAKTFSNSADEHAIAGDEPAENNALYNRGVSQVRNGQYQEAIDSFNNVLDRDPSHADAEHNRTIAEKLMQLQQQQQQPESQDGDGGNENPEQGEQQSQPEDGEQGEQNEQQPSDSEEQSQSSEEQASTGGDQSSDPVEEQGAEQQQDNESPPDNEEQDQKDAEQALAAEAAENKQSDAQDEQGSESELTESPMSEADQSAEQLLRRIPDDPAGLLRRKLEQSHRSEYPEVGNARQPW